MLQAELIKKTKQINVPKDLPVDPDAFTLGQQQHLHEEKEKIEIDRLNTELNNLKSSFKISNWFAGLIFLFVLGWIISVFCFLVWQGHLPLTFRLSDNVLITLLSTTTINILGLLFLVIKYVFNHRLQVK